MNPPATGLRREHSGRFRPAEAGSKPPTPGHWAVREWLKKVRCSWPVLCGAELPADLCRAIIPCTIRRRALPDMIAIVMHGCAGERETALPAPSYDGLWLAVPPLQDGLAGAAGGFAERGLRPVPLTPTMMASNAPSGDRASPRTLRPLPSSRGWVRTAHAGALGGPGVAEGGVMQLACPLWS